MLFLIHFEVTVPADTPEELKEQLRQGEHARVFEFIEAGKLRRIWRPVGTADTCCLWEADSLEELHAAVRSLPLYPYMKLSITPLVEHPAAVAWEKAHGPMPTF
ncbi:MAG TPA: muconolactone Delta-isomerase family protein [Pseudomonas sp.]|uniref:muconolactone Delta-isomerase n=1 Tax=Pseudomonas sp. TaxID=306 RepID=UPI002C14ACB6|nr:muconolactone Delta-isomerase family protein [Pseudomonas sp.]HRL92406.1 muconolactone Delta-isomerase family protein [Pseudomonas sp.]